MSLFLHKRLPKTKLLDERTFLKKTMMHIVKKKKLKM